MLSYLIFSFLNYSCLLVPKYSEYFTWSAPPTLYSWSDSQIGCSAPLYSRSVSLIRSAYFSLYINFCFGFNKTLTNLTSLRQHRLQYNAIISNFLFRHWHWADAIILGSFILGCLSLLQSNHLLPFPRIDMNQNTLNKMKQKIN